MFFLNLIGRIDKRGLLAIACIGALVHVPSAAECGWISSGHSGGLADMGVSTDGSLVVTASEDGTAKVWQVSDGALVRTLSGHGSEVTGATFLQGDTRIATSSRDEMVRVYDASSGSLLLTLSGHEAPVRCIAGAGSTIASGDDAGEVRIWNGVSGALIVSHPSHADAVLDVAFSPNGQYFASCGADDSVRVWLVNPITAIATITDHTDEVLDVCFSPDSNSVATASLDGSAMTFDLLGSPLVSLSGHDGGASCVAFSLGGQILYTGDGLGKTRAWSLANGQELQSTQAHASSVTSLLQPAAGVLLSASLDATWKSWQIPSGDLNFGHPRNLAAVTGLSFSADGSVVAASTYDSSLWVAVAATGGETFSTLNGLASPPPMTLPELMIPALDVSLSPDGSRVAVASADGKLRVWDTGGGSLVVETSAAAYPTSAAVFSPDGSRVVCGYDDGWIRSWNATNGILEWEVDSHQDSIQCIVFAPNGNQIASAGHAGGLFVRNASNGGLVWSVTEESSLTSVDYTPDGSILAYGSRDNCVRLRTTAAGTLVATFDGHEESVEAVAFHAAGAELFSASIDGEVRNWRVLDGALLSVEGAGTSGILALEYSSATGRRIVGRLDGTVECVDP